MPDYMIGVSAGAAYGVSMASGQIGRNLRFLLIIEMINVMWDLATWYTEITVLFMGLISHLTLFK